MEADASVILTCFVVLWLLAYDATVKLNSSNL